MAEKQTNKERLKDITDSIEQGIKDLFESDKYKQYLLTMSHFHKYSVNNQMLIYMQRPNATFVTGFNNWRDRFGRSVMKGEKGIKIIAPTPFKKKIEQEKLDPDTKLPMLDADGKVIIEEKEIKVPMFKPVVVFDVSQTDGKPLPELASALSGNVKDYDIFMEAVKRSSPVPISFEQMSSDTDGYFNLAHQRIAIREGMSEVQTVCAAIHEIAHSKLHNSNNEEKRSRSTQEIQAESISFAVCAYYGIETGENSFGYLASWAKDKELKELRESLETINQTSSSLISDINRNYMQIMKERGLDKEVKSEVESQKLSFDNLPDSEISVEDMNEYGYSDDKMLPLTKEKAIEFISNDVTVYMLYPDNTEAMAFDEKDIEEFDGIFGIEVDEWESVKERFGINSPDYEKAFIENPEDSFIIYQLKTNDDTSDIRFAGTDYLDEKGLTVDKNNYDAVYAADLMYSGDTAEKLNGLYQTFNINRPDDFKGHSMSISDIIALKENGVVSYHYVDTHGFKELKNFGQPENHLKSAEMSTEDDYGMIDGVINNGKKQTVSEIEADAMAGKPISLTSYAQALKREQAQKNVPKSPEKKPSVLAQLHSAGNQPTKKAPIKGEERGR